MKIYKIEGIILDQDVETIEDARSVIKSARYANHTNVEILNIYEADIGEWSDDHPLNYDTTYLSEIKKIFGE
jgi:hypothetical protein